MPEIDVNAVIWATFYVRNNESSGTYCTRLSKIIYVPSRTLIAGRSNSCSISHQKSWVLVRKPNGMSTIGNTNRSMRTTLLNDRSKQKYTLSLMRHFCLLAKFIHIHNQLTHEKRQLRPSQVSSIDANSTVLMGNQSCSSVTSSQETSKNESKKTHFIFMSIHKDIDGAVPLVLGWSETTSLYKPLVLTLRTFARRALPRPLSSPNMCSRPR